MVHSLRYYIFIGLLFTVVHSSAQSPFSTVEYIDVNNIRAAHLVHGDMWNNPDTVIARCEFPKGSGINIGYSSSLWLAGYDNNNQLRASGQLYRNDGKVDFWPGPLETSASIPYAESEDWAKIWKLNRSDLDNFLNTAVHTVNNTHPAILEWPASGNIYARGNNNAQLNLGQRQYAPFVDINNNSIYEPLQGEYPAMKGDQTLWYIFNDSGPIHTVSGTDPLGVEITMMVYGYKRNSVVDNIVYYEYTITNRTASPIDSFAFGVFADLDLGWGYDDFVGFDSSRNLGFMYNGDGIDGTNSPTLYTDTIPITAIRILKWNSFDSCQKHTDAGSFMYIDKSSIFSADPSNGAEMNHFLRSRWRNGIPLTNDYQGPGIPSSGKGGTLPAKYVFPGNPTQASQWSECSSGNPANVLTDKSIIIASSPQSLLPGQKEQFSYALMASPRKFQNGCPNLSFQDILDVSDTAKKVFCNPPVYTSVKDATIAKSALNIYPNPAGSTVYMDTPAGQNEEVMLFDGIGRTIHIEMLRKGNRIEMNVGNLAKGVYHILYRSENHSYSGSFFKD